MLTLTFVDSTGESKPESITGPWFQFTYLLIRDSNENDIAEFDPDTGFWMRYNGPVYTGCYTDIVIW